ncbi:MAG: hypothetical protein AB2708_13525 [Candidatus Thiodiazotropha taylori]
MHFVFFSFNFRYPKYQFIHDVSISRSASLKTRYGDSSLRGLLKDFYCLLECDFVVCAFHSNVCNDDFYSLVHWLYGSGMVSFPFWY